MSRREAAIHSNRVLLPEEEAFISRRKFLQLSAGAFVGATLLGVADCSSQGQGGSNYPSQNITYTIPFDAGGESDLTARIQQKPLKDVLNVAITVTDKPGGGGAVAWSQLSRTKPDGYTIFGFNLPHIIVQPLGQQNAGFKTNDIKPVYTFQYTPNILFVQKSSGIKSLKDFVKQAKHKPNSISVGGTGKLTTNQLATVEFEDAAGIKLSYVPFTGTAAVVPAFLGKQVDSAFSYTTVLPQLKGKGTPIAVAADKRSKALPHVPTFKEQGYDIVEGAYRGVAVPSGTPDNVVNTLSNAFKKVSHKPEVISQEKKLGLVDLVYWDPKKSENYIQKRQKYYTKLLNKLDMTQ